MKTFSCLLWTSLACTAVTAAVTESAEVLERGLQEDLLCRCEASWEDFYSRRLEEGRRELQQFYHYDYNTVDVDGNGHFVVEGVVVLPSSECEMQGSSRQLVEEEEEGEEQLRELKYRSRTKRGKWRPSPGRCGGGQASKWLTD